MYISSKDMGFVTWIHLASSDRCVTDLRTYKFSSTLLN